MLELEKYKVLVYLLEITDSLDDTTHWYIFFSVRMAILTIRPSEKGFTILYIIVASDDGCTLTLLLFLPSSSESHKTEKDKIEFL